MTFNVVVLCTNRIAAEEYCKIHNLKLRLMYMDAISLDTNVKYKFITPEDSDDKFVGCIFHEMRIYDSFDGSIYYSEKIGELFIRLRQYFKVCGNSPAIKLDKK